MGGDRPTICRDAQLHVEQEGIDGCCAVFGRFGVQMRQLPHDFPPYSTVHSFYRRARISGLWDKILEHLVKKTRINAGRKESPSYAIIDSQSVKTVAASEDRGIDGGKKQKAESGTL